MQRILAAGAALWLAVVALPAERAGSAEPNPKAAKANPAAGTEDQAPGAADAAQRAPRRTITISKETTRITEPLRKDGYVDFLAALDALASQGVTADNNASVLLWQAAGPRGTEAAPIDPDFAERLFAMLGVAQPPDAGDYFVAFQSLAKTELGDSPEPDKVEKLWNELDVALSRPWKAADCPLVAKWLQVNAKPLELIESASRRPRRYDPLISDDRAVVINALMPGAQQAREFVRALAARAMQRAGSGDLGAAWSDLLACHRLARLIGQGPFLIDELVCYGLDAIACTADQGLLAHPKLTAAQALKMRADLEKLPPLPATVDRLDVAERYLMLDCTALIARDGIQASADVTGLGGGDNAGGMSKALMAIADQVIDWDAVLRSNNQWVDRLVEAWRKPTRGERVLAITAVNEALGERTLASRTALPGAILNPGPVLTQFACDATAGLMLPGLMLVGNAEDGARVRFDLVRLGCALAAYRSERGKYPTRLADLVPKHVATIPPDLFAGGELQYKPAAKGYVLYSIGVNGRDDDGQTSDDAGTGDADDLVLRVPPQSKPDEPKP